MQNGFPHLGYPDTLMAGYPECAILILLYTLFKIEILMEHETLKKIINEFGAINVQVPLKIPERLMSRLDSKATDWISKEDRDKEIVFNCNEKIRDLKEIVELAEFSISQSQRFSEKEVFKKFS